MLSKTSQYALRAVHQLARVPHGERVPAVDIAGSLGVPSNYLSKILHVLGRAGVLDSVRGPHGGFALARPAGAISLAEVLDALGEHPPERMCLLGRGQCRDADPCPAHDQWKDVSERVRDFFEETTVADLSGDDPRPVPTGA